MKKLWEAYGELPEIGENPEIILNEYASKLKSDTDNMFSGVVTESIAEDSGVITYALYILVPKLKDYMYRLIEVNIQDLVTPYPLEIKLFAKVSINNRSVYASNVEEFKEKLEYVITSPITKGILFHLKTLIEIKKISSKE